MTAYWTEFRAHWRPMLAATAGLSAGMSLNAYVNSVFGPYLIAAFGWSKAEFALMGVFSLLTLVCIPAVGRLSDIFGVRRVAAVGIVAYPLTCLLLATMTGDIRVFFAIVVLQIVLGMSTTTTVYCRVVAERFEASRGLALAVAVAGPAVVGAVGSPVITAYMDAYGWRAGYYALAAYSAVIGALAFAWLPRAEAAAPGQARPVRRSMGDYRLVARSRAFWIILFSSLLCSLPHALANSQIKVMLLEHQVSSAEAGLMVSIFAAGVLGGRFVAGVALDRLPTHVVAALAMGLPALGLFILATDVTALPLLALAVSLIGLSFGAEGDILAYAAARYFRIEIYGTVLGLLTAAVGAAITLGSVILSLTLAQSDSFRLFMLIAGVSVLAGALNFLRLREAAARDAAPGAMELAR